MFVLGVNGENETSKLLHFWPKRVEFRSYVDRCCIWVQNVARNNCRMVDGAYFSGFSTFLSEKMQLSRGFAVGQSIFPLVSARWKLGSLRQLSSFPLGYPKTVSV